MITFKLLEKEEVSTLFEILDTPIMQIPIKHPTKELQRYIPKGFRPDKLQRSQLLKIYVDAVTANEPGLLNYISNLFEKILGDAGINEYMNNIRNDSDSTATVMANITTNIINNDVCLPPHIVMKLYGVECDASLEKTSKSLYDAINSQRDRYGNKRFEEGLDKARKENNEEIEDGRKKLTRLQKNLNNEADKANQYIKRIEELENENKNQKLIIENDSKKIEELNIFLAEIQACKKNNEFSEYRIEEYTHEIEKLKEKQRLDSEIISKLQKRIKEYEKKEDVISDEFVKSVAVEVVSAIRAESIIQKDIISIAKQKLKENYTILSGWEKLSSDSINSLESLLKCIFEKEITRANLDDIDCIESNVIIEYAIINALKSNVLSTLSSQDNSIQDRFEIIK